MAVTLALAQTKGGVGKSTVGLNVAAVLKRRGRTPVVVDTDPAMSASAIAAEGKLTFEVQTLLLESDDEADVRRWRDSLRAIEADYIIVDAPGAMGPAFAAAITMADLVLLPSGVTMLELRGAAETIKTIRRQRKRSGRSGPKLLIVPSRIDRRTGIGRDAVTILKNLGEHVGPVISYRAAVAASFDDGRTVDSITASADEFEALVDEIEKMMAAAG